jgi:hypothetical protein
MYACDVDNHFSSGTVNEVVQSWEIPNVIKYNSWEFPPDIITGMGGNFNFTSL